MSVFPKQKFVCCFIRSTHSEVFFKEISSIHWEVLFQIKCSEYSREIPRKTAATEHIFNIVMGFQYALCRGQFSRNFPKNFRTAFSKNTACGKLLILRDCSLKISRTPFNPSAPGGNKKSSYIKETFQLRLAGLFKYVCPFVTTSIKGLKNTTG